MDLTVEKSETLYGREFVKLRADLSLIRDEGDEPNIFHIILDHNEIPKILATHGSDDSWAILLDDRIAFPLDIPNDEFAQVIDLLANSMAVAAGFSCFGKGSQVSNPYRSYPMPDLG